jgi:hypothetical protein
LRKRLIGALVAYGILIGLACIVLHGQVLYAVLILFAGLLAKTLIAVKAGWHDPE